MHNYRSFSAVAACMYAAVVYGATINVPTDQSTIQGAIGAAAGGDTIVVAAGTYTETITVTKDLTLRSAAGAAVTTLQPAAAGQAVITIPAGRTAATTIEGFTITGADRTTGGGGALEIQDAAPLVRGNVIRGNSTSQGGAAIRVTSSDGSHAPVIVNNVIRGNSATTTGGAVAVNNAGALVFAGNTVHGNSAATGGGFLVEAGSTSLQIIDSIFWSNGASNLSGVTSAMISYCDVDGGAPAGGTGNIASDPQFVDAASGNLHLVGTSPCHNAGTSLGALTADFEGDARDTTPDIGADEYRVPPVSALACTPGALDVVLTWTNGWTGYTSLAIYRDGGGTPIATPAGTDVSFTDSPVAPGDHTYSVTALFNAEQSAATTCAAVHVDVPAPTALACTLNVDKADLSWTNGYAYASVRVLRNGVEVALLAGTATSYQSTTLDVGATPFQVIGVFSGLSSAPAACTVSRPLPPPTGLTCTPGAASLSVALQWTNSYGYSSIEILRGGALVQTLTGSPTSFDDALTAPGIYTYSIVGKYGAFTSAAAECVVTASYVAPVTITGCTVDAGRIAHLAWTNGATTYSGISIFIDGAEASGSPVTGGAASYTSVALTPGAHTFAVQPFIGTYQANAVSCGASAPLPPPTGLSCTPAASSLTVTLAWTNGWGSYDNVIIRRGGAQIANLAGTATTYNDTVSAPGSYSYEVYGTLGTLNSTNAACTAVPTYVAPVTITQCTIGADRIARLTWSNGAANYTRIAISIDGTAQTPLAGTATSFVSPALAPGNHDFIVRPHIDPSYDAAAATCSATAPLPPPTAFTCTPVAGTLTVALSWTNGWPSYSGVVIRRDSTTITTLAGTATSYTDTLLLPGHYVYEIYGTLAAQQSTAVTCPADVTYVAPVTNLACTIGADRIAHLTWSNGAANYSSIAISIDGTAQTPLAGTATSFDSTALAPGSRTFSVQPHIIPTYDAVAATCNATAPLPPPTGLTCTASTTSAGVTLAWTNGWGSYTSVIIRRGGTQIASVAGTSTSYADTVPNPGTYNYEVIGRLGTTTPLDSTAAAGSCESRYVAPVASLACTIGTDRIAHVSWANGAANYTRIAISIDGTAQTPVAGTATSFVSAALAPGAHNFSVQPHIDPSYDAVAATTSGTAPLPPPSGLTCSPSTTSAGVSLTWTNGWTYNSVVVARGGSVLATLSGTPTGYTDTVPAPGNYTYTVYGTLATQNSTPATCGAESTYVAPLAITQCTIGADRIAQLAWTNGAANYSGIYLLIDAAPVAQSPLGGTVAAYTSAALAPGAHTFSLQPYLGSYHATATTCNATAPLPPPTAFTCTPSTTSLGVTLAWTNGWSYGSVVIRRNGSTLTTLSGAPVTYTDTVPSPGSYAYEVYGVLSAQSSTVATCTAVATYVAPVTITQCTIGTDRIAHLTWTNGAANYTGIAVLNDGTAVTGSPFGGTTSTYTSAVLAPGTYTFTVQPSIGTYQASPRTCSATAPLPAPTSLACTASTTSLGVTLAWTNGWTYNTVVIRRNGSVVQTLTGSPTGYADTVPTPGNYAYEVYGTLGALSSSAATGNAEATYVAPVTITQCTVGADRIAHLAWTNGVDYYDSVAVLLDGTAVTGSPFAGTTTTYASPALSPGSHTFSVRPTVDSYQATAATCAPVAPLPPPGAFTCATSPSSLGVALAWTNGWSYGSVVIRRDGSTLATLSGTATSYADTVSSPGAYAYEVYGVLSGQNSTSAACSAEPTYVAPVTITQCTIGADRIAHLTWTNGAANYTGITVLNEGAAVSGSPFGGTTTTYTSAALNPGTYTFTVQPSIGTYQAEVRTCAATAPLPAPSAFTATPSTTSLAVALAWTNGWTYNTVVIRRGGTVIQTLTGSPTAFTDTVLSPGIYSYEVYGTLGAQSSATASAGATAAFVAPVTITQCTVGANRIAQLVWTNGGTYYGGITLTIDGAAAPGSPLAATATTYDSAALQPGAHTFGIQPYVGSYQAAAATCGVDAPLPPPTALVCTPGTDNLSVTLTWTNGWPTYTNVVIRRDGTTIQTLSGSIETYVDTLSSPGAHAYEVYGTSGTLQSQTATCNTDSTYVAPVAITQLTIGADRIAHLTWTNGAANYTGIHVRIDGTAVSGSPLAGTATSYVSAALAPGSHTFSIQPYIGGYQATATTSDATAPLPPPVGLTCTPAGSALTIALQWTNGWTYANVVVSRDGTTIATLGGAATTFTDTLSSPGAHTYGVRGTTATLQSTLASCATESTYVAPATITQCTTGADRIARLAWTNGAANYTGIVLTIDGAAVPQSPLAAATTAYVSAALEPGTHTISVQPYIGAYTAVAATCSVAPPLPPPTAFTCTPSAGAPTVALAWTNGWPTYSNVVVRRDGATVQTLAGTATGFTDTVPLPGQHAYQVYGTLNALTSLIADCTAESTYVAPVTVTQCTIGADRIARLAWTNGGTNYAGIYFLIDGTPVAQSPLGGTATSYNSSPLDPGSHTFSLQPFIGTYTAIATTSTAAAPLPPPSGLTCTPAGSALTIALQWTNGWTYTSVAVARDGAVIATLGGSSTTYTDTLAAPGAHAYDVYGTTASQQSNAASCAAESTYVAPVVITQCTTGADRIARLTWTNGAANYAGIVLTIDGTTVPQSPLAGTATAYTSAALAPGAHTIGIQPYIGSYTASARACSIDVPLPPPTSLTCTPAANALTVALAWTNGWPAYTSIVIRRGGTTVQTLAGTASAFSDTLAAPGQYTYEVYGTLNTLSSSSATCNAVATYVAPVTVTQCAIGTDRIGRLAWTNGAANYAGIVLTIDGTAVAQSPLAGTATSFESSALDPGSHTFSLRPFIGSYDAATTTCSATAPLPPATAFTCAAPASSLAIPLAWTNGWTYTGVVVRRDGAAIANLAGTATAYTDTLAAPGAHTYEVLGTTASQQSTTVACAMEAKYVAPAAITQCTIDAGRIAHLAWTNGVANYTGMVLSIDGAAVAQSPLAGTATTYTSAALNPGSHTFSVQPYIGTYNATAATCTAVAPLPPPTAFTCTASTASLSVTLAWTNGWAYDSVIVRRGGATIRTLTGATTTITDTLTLPGSYAYEIYGVLAGQNSGSATCTVEQAFVPPAAITACTIDANRVAHLTWTNGAANYDGIALLIDGTAVPQSPLAGTAGSFDSAALTPGSHAFAVRPSIGAYQATAASCSATAPLPSPTGLTCTPGSSNLFVSLAWTNGWSYQTVVIRRNGAVLQTLTGSPAAYTDTLPAPGNYSYEVYGTLAAQQSGLASCALEATYVAPVAITACTIGSDRIAHIAWTNGATNYAAIALLIDGAAAPGSPLAGTATTYTSAALNPGQHSISIQPIIGSYQASPRSCTAEAPLPPPTGLVCTPATGNLNVALVWSNGWTYQSVVIRRNGTTIRTLSGSPTSYTDTAPAPGNYSYDVYGTLGSQNSLTAACGAETTYTAPVTITSCSFDTSRVAHLVWTNGATNYDGITLLIDGAAAPGSPLAGGAAAYTSAVLTPGTHTFALRPFIGTYQAADRTCSADAPLPAPTALTCTPGSGNLTVVLTWTNGWTYDSVVVRRDGVAITTLAGAVAGYTDTLTAPGAHTYDVYGVLGIQQSSTATCSTDATYVSPVTITECTIDASRIAHLAWTNGADNYSGITLSVDGVAAPGSPLAGGTTTFTSAALTPGQHTFVLQPYIGAYQATQRTCAAEAPLPPPSGLICTPAGASLQVALAWTNNWTYASMLVRRDGVTIATLAAGAIAYNDTLSAPGAHAYQVAGVLGSQTSGPATCNAEATYVAPLALTSCTIGTDRVAQLTWTNGAANYGGITLLIDGVAAAQSPLAGTALSYSSAALSPGQHSFALEPFIGTYRGATVSCTADAPLPPASGLTCTAGVNNLNVALVWTNGWAYQSIIVRRDGAVIRTLSGAPSSYTDPLPAPGTYRYDVYGTLGSLQSPVATCTTEATYVAPVAIAQCLVDTSRIARLTWTNGAANYDRIDVSIDGAAATGSPLAGTATSYSSPALAPGVHTFTLRPSIGAYQASQAACTAEAVLPPPTGATCAATTGTLTVSLAWTNGWTYDQVIIRRDGSIAATLAGAPTSYADTLPAPGTHNYQILGVLGSQQSTAALCSVDATYVAPPTITECSIDAARSAHLAWTNGSTTYDGIIVQIDGIPEATLAGSATSFVTAALYPGHHTFSIRPYVGTYQAAVATCSGDVAIPPPSNFTCVPVADSWRVTLAWTNGWAYGSMTLVRNGIPVATLAGAPTSFNDTLEELGTTTYELYGSIGTRNSPTATCTTEVTFVAPVTLGSCSVDAGRVARLAWTNGTTSYDGIAVLVNGTPAPGSPLAGSATTYTSPPLEPASYTFAVQPFVGAFQGAVRECTGTATLPPPTGFTAAAAADAWAVALAWTNGWTYDTVVVSRDGVSLAELAGTAASFTDTAPGLGTFTYQVHGVRGGLASAAVTASVIVSIVPAVTITQCTVNENRNAQIAWTNGAPTYEGINLLIDGVPAPESPLPGSATSYASAPLGPGGHTIVVEPFIGAVRADERGCAPGAPLPAPHGLTCVPAASSWQVALTWTNGWTYSSVTIRRNGTAVATLSGSPRAYVDTVPAPGFHTYDVYGSLAGQDSDPVTCSTEVTFVPPVASLTCDFEAARIAHLSWTNGASNYDRIELTIDGVAAPQSPLGGGAVQYDSAALVPGSHTFALTPIIGAYRAAAAQVTATSPLPPVGNVTCAVGADVWRITLAWTLGWTYDNVVLVRDGAQLASLGGTALTYVDNLGGPGAHTYEIYGVLAGQSSLRTPCAAEIVYVPPVAVTQCLFGQDRVARLAWTNGATNYDRIEVRIDGVAVPESPLPGATTSYASAPLVPGAHTVSVQPVIGSYQAVARECAGTAIVPAPTTLVCTVPTDGWRVLLEWADNWQYDGVTVVRNATAIATLDGTATSYADIPPALGTYTYEIIAAVGGQDSAHATCSVTLTIVPPVAVTTCEIDTARVAHLAWTLGEATYTGIRILIDGTVVATLDGTAESYDSAVLQPGPHTFLVRPFAGAVPAADASASADAPPPAPTGLTCSLPTGLWQVELAWTNAFAYDQIRILRDDAEIFAGDGTTATYVDSVPRPGVYRYTILGRLGSRYSDPAACTIEPATVPPVTIAQCVIGDDRVLSLAWTNGVDSYEGIALSIDGRPVAESPLAGMAAGYVSAALNPGTHTVAITPFIGTYQAETAACSGTALLPAPIGFACATVGESWDVNLTWTNAWKYGSVTIMRDGTPVATLTGAPVNYVDTVFGIGTYVYEIYGSLGIQNSVTVSCSTEIIMVPPTIITRCEVDDQQRAQLAWANGVEAYDGIDILIDGALTADSPRPGSSMTYSSAPLGPGLHSFTVHPFMGTHRAQAAVCESAAAPPPPTGLVCTASKSALQVIMTWTNQWTYESVVVIRNGVEVATLPGSPTTYTDDVPANGSYAYVVAGALGAESSRSDGCIVGVSFVAKPTGLHCTTSGTNAHLSWTNPIEYDEIEVERDGEPIGAYPGDTTTLDDTLPDENTHQYLVIGRVGRFTSEAATCSTGAHGVGTFVRADMNSDGIVNIADPIFLLGYLFRSDREPSCMESANVNNDTKVDIADVIYMLGYLFREKSPPAPPFPGCGTDPEGGTNLGCTSYTPCSK